jgi:hypothetical protein
MVAEPQTCDTCWVAVAAHAHVHLTKLHMIQSPGYQSMKLAVAQKYSLHQLENKAAGCNTPGSSIEDCPHQTLGLRRVCCSSHPRLYMSKPAAHGALMLLQGRCSTLLPGVVLPGVPWYVTPHTACGCWLRSALALLGDLAGLNQGRRKSTQQMQHRLRG